MLTSFRRLHVVPQLLLIMSGLVAWVLRFGLSVFDHVACGVG